MGATTFVTKVETSLPLDKAFAAAHEEAAWEHGHGGYTGTIAEKPNAILFDLPEGVGWEAVVQALEASYPVHYRDEETGEWKLREPQRPKWADKVPWDRMVSLYDDKWGPAVALRTEDGYVFCGWASC